MANLAPRAMLVSHWAIHCLACQAYYAPIHNGVRDNMKTIAIASEAVTVQITEFEMTALVALVERGIAGVDVGSGDAACIRAAIVGIAEEFADLMGHFELAA